MFNVEVSLSKIKRKRQRSAQARSPQARWLDCR
jgi:hypothetical protein